MMANLASKLQLRFYRIILKLSKSTPSCMVYGELGQLPLEVQAKCRMLNFWFNLVNTNYKFKFSNIMYKFLYECTGRENINRHFFPLLRRSLTRLA